MKMFVFNICGIVIVLFSSIISAQDVTVTADTSVTYQRFEGMGAALAFYQNWVTAHPNKEGMYDLVFTDLGLDILRIRNIYGYDDTFEPYSEEFVSEAKERDPDIRILMCSWSPPAELKDDGTTSNGTLKKEGGEFVYDSYADYWYNSLVAYREIGIDPDYISIQNEPDYLTDDWETCKFEPEETSDHPGYKTAFDKVYTKLSSDLSDPPMMIGAEPLGIGYNNFSNYTDPIKSHEGLYGYAYHLYHGGDEDDPETFVENFNHIRDNYSDRPNFMTEYSRGGWFETAMIAFYNLKEANSSGYYYWDLIWDGGGLVSMDNPWDSSEWSNDSGYTITPDYYAVKHFSKHLGYGYRRIETSGSDQDVLNLAFLSSDSSSITFVVVNTGDSERGAGFTAQGLELNNFKGYQSVENDYYQVLEVDSGLCTLPGRSITTVTTDIKDGVPVMSGSDRDIGSDGIASVVTGIRSDKRELLFKKGVTGDFMVTDIKGREIISGEIRNRIDLTPVKGSGIYFLMVKTGNTESKHMILLR